jgi:hypothetical protein
LVALGRGGLETTEIRNAILSVRGGRQLRSELRIDPFPFPRGNGFGRADAGCSRTNDNSLNSPKSTRIRNVSFGAVTRKAHINEWIDLIEMLG